MSRNHWIQINREEEAGLEVWTTRDGSGGFVVRVFYDGPVWAPSHTENHTCKNRALAAHIRLLTEHREKRLSELSQ